MKKTLLIVSLALLFLAITPLAISLAFTDNTTYTTVYVKPGDTVWQIASKYTTDKDDVREVVFEIRKINKLDNNAHVYPGQALKVPVRS